jgi:DNA-binding MarR family transcriptional regulator
MTNLQPFKAYLAAFRSCSPTTTAATAEALLHVADGVDSVSELQEVMNLSSRTAHRIVSTLLGRAAYVSGSWKPSPFSLLEARPHPHKGGRQLLLTDQGQHLVDSLRTPGKNQ